jgi:predicted amidohydrolase
MRAAAIQLDIVRGDIAHNMAAVERETARLAETARPDVITLPELWSTGYALPQARELATPMGQREAEFLGELARRYHVAFAGGSVLSLEGGRIFNRAQVIDAEGRYVGGYNKMHLFRPMEEDRWLAQGEQLLLFTLGGMACASVICYDIRFCELPRRLALDGAEVLFVSAEWPSPRIEHWSVLLRARAIENQLYIVACNRCGVTGSERFGGRSAIIAPDGTILAEAGEEEASISAELDTSLPSDLRRSFPVFADRVPALY